VKGSVADEVLEAGGPVDEASVTLAIYGETLQPKDVSLLLSLEPTSSFEVGYRRGPSSPPVAHGAWLLELRGNSPLEVDDLATMLLARLPVEHRIWEKLHQLYKVQLRVALHMESWNRGFGLSHATLKRLADTGVDVSVDVYSRGDGDA
jgi:hypothetical protein